MCFGQSTWRKLNLSYSFENCLGFRQRSVRGEGFQTGGIVWGKEMSIQRSNNAGWYLVNTWGLNIMSVSLQTWFISASPHEAGTVVISFKRKRKHRQWEQHVQSLYCWAKSRGGVGSRWPAWRELMLLTLGISESLGMTGIEGTSWCECWCAQMVGGGSFRWPWMSEWRVWSLFLSRGQLMRASEKQDC